MAKPMTDQKIYCKSIGATLTQSITADLARLGYQPQRIQMSAASAGSVGSEVAGLPVVEADGLPGGHYWFDEGKPGQLELI